MQAPMFLIGTPSVDSDFLFAHIKLHSVQVYPLKSFLSKASSTSTTTTTVLVDFHSSTQGKQSSLHFALPLRRATRMKEG